jgi:hypothetical protein
MRTFYPVLLLKAGNRFTRHVSRTLVIPHNSLEEMTAIPHTDPTNASRPFDPSNK